MPRMSHATTTERSSVSAASMSAAVSRGGAGAQRQPRRAQVLGLHRQQPRDDVRDAGRARAVQELRRRAGATQRGRRGRLTGARGRARVATSCRGVISGVTRTRGSA